jgi:hypothetical protein
VLAEYLRHYVEDQTNRDEWVPFATYEYNTTVPSASGFTPFELLFGRPSVLRPLKKPAEPQYNYDDCFRTEKENANSLSQRPLAPDREKG